MANEPFYSGNTFGVTGLSDITIQVYQDVSGTLTAFGTPVSTNIHESPAGDGIYTISQAALVAALAAQTPSKALDPATFVGWLSWKSATIATVPFDGYIISPDVSSDPLAQAVPGSYEAGTAGYDIAAILTDIAGITSGAVTVVSPVAVVGSAITALRGDAWSINLSGLGDISARTKLWLTAKASVGDPDSAAVLQIIENFGLTIINGATGTAANASITVTNAVTGALTIVVKGVETAKLDINGFSYDVQILEAAGPRTVVEGTLRVTADITEATS